MKTLLKSVHIYQSYCKKNLAQFFGPPCIYTQYFNNCTGRHFNLSIDIIYSTCIWYNSICKFDQQIGPFPTALILVVCDHRRLAFKELGFALLLFKQIILYVDLFCRKFAVVCQKIACFLPGDFLTQPCKTIRR